MKGLWTDAYFRLLICHLGSFIPTSKTVWAAWKMHPECGTEENYAKLWGKRACCGFVLAPVGLRPSCLSLPLSSLPLEGNVDAWAKDRTIQPSNPIWDPGLIWRAIP